MWFYRLLDIFWRSFPRKIHNRWKRHYLNLDSLHTLIYPNWGFYTYFSSRWNFFLHLAWLSLNHTLRPRHHVPKIWPKLKILSFIFPEVEEKGILGLTAWYKAEKSHPTSRSILSCFEGETSAESTSGWAHWEPTWPETETWTPEDSHCKKTGGKWKVWILWRVTEVKCCNNYSAAIHAHFWSDTIQ